MTAQSRECPFTQVIIIGAGISGLAMACQLKRQLNCKDLVIYDRAPGLGGTWYTNTYPGCGVDIPGAFYSLSFAPNPEFSQFFPKQVEILQYINNVAKEFNVIEHFVGNTEWVGASWQDDEASWLVNLRETSTGRVFTHQCKILISAVGGLSNPNECIIPGFERFQGDIVHTAKWNPNISCKQKNVIVIGNGSSATQVIPEIAKEAKMITQFIRTSQHYIPSQNTAISALWRTIFRKIPGSLWLYRLMIFLYLESSIFQFDRTWLGEKMRNDVTVKCRRYITDCAPARYWSLLFPSFEVGCKRRIFDNDGYLACLHGSNVSLTNDSIVSLLEQSVLTKSGDMHPADVIVLATGFSPTQHDVDLRGRGGYCRQEHWKQFGHMRTFNTVAMARFPNFFYILGPNSGRGHTSTVHTAESYIELVIRVVKPVLQNDASTVEVKDSSEESFSNNLRAALANTVLTNACRSWYIDPKTEQNWFIYPWSSLRMWYSTRWSGMGDWSYKSHKPQGDSQKELSLQVLSNAIPDHCFRSSVFVSFAYLGRDIAYSGILIYCALHIQFLPHPWARAASWAMYSFAQGCVGTGLWIIAHECGHGSFSSFSWLNDIVGWVIHSSLLVPYFPWKITHARHHRYSGHMEKDTAFVPFTEEEFAAKREISIQGARQLTEDTPLINLIHLIVHQLFGWPMYLFFSVSAGNKSTPGNRKSGYFSASHFDPYSALFTSAQRMYVVLSDLGVLVVGLALLHMSSKIGIGNALLLYLTPYLWVNSWIVAITYLHHTHPSVPHYAGQSWTFMKGVLGTVDRSIGFIGRHFFHEIIDYHVIHHLFPKIPFYKAEEATMAIKPLLGPSYREEKKENFIFSLFKTFQRCKYVSDGGGSPSEDGLGIFHWHEHKR